MILDGEKIKFESKSFADFLSKLQNLALSEKHFFHITVERPKHQSYTEVNADSIVTAPTKPNEIQHHFFPLAISMRLASFAFRFFLDFR